MERLKFESIRNQLTVADFKLKLYPDGDCHPLISKIKDMVKNLFLQEPHHENLPEWSGN